MILHLGPKRLMWIGFAMMILGIVFPILMIMRVLESTIFLNFLSFFLSLVGLIIGMAGTGLYAAIHRKMKKDE
ncbi:MAG: hypothetical protein GYA58_15755 [Anaerolineaceae bacterium]|jgi:hypothetical protein|nr:hypothetical protein [Anaerolineaceae bacterium]